jgi:hypothetical protein
VRHLRGIASGATPVELYIIGRPADLELPALSLEDGSADAQAMETASKKLKQTLSPAAFLPGAARSYLV